MVLKINELINDDESTLQSIANVIQFEPGLSARLLNIANSPGLRSSMEISSLQTALSRLGIVMVRDLVMALNIKDLFKSTDVSINDRLSKILKHSQEVACIGSCIAKHKRLSFLPETVLLAGIIHEIGQLPIIKLLEFHPELIDDVNQLDQLIERFKPIVGEAISKYWNLNRQLKDVITEKNNDKLECVDIIKLSHLILEESNTAGMLLEAKGLILTDEDINIIKGMADEQMKAVSKLFK